MARSRIRAAAVRLAVGAVVVAAGIAGSTAPAAAAGSICPVPAPLALPAAARVVGTGDAKSCTEDALRTAVTAGGSITFACGSAPVTIALTKALQVTATTVVDGGGLVTLDGAGRDRVFFVANSTTLSVRNTTLVGGHAAEVEDRDRGAGGAIAGMYQVRVEIIDSTLARNVAGQGGGAVFVGTDSRLTITGSRFAHNRAWLGGAVYSLLSPLTVSGSTFVKNRTTNTGGHGDGGAIFTDGAAPREANRGGLIAVCRSVVKDNQAYGGGGGAMLFGYDKDRILLYRTTFAGNAVGTNSSGNKGLGGAARISVAQDGARNGTITMSRASFLRNTSGGSGGALYLDCGPRCVLRNSTFSGNSTGGYGGAVYGDGHQDNGVTYAGNRAGGAGGAVAGKRIVFRNTVFSGNSAANRWGGSMTCSEKNTGTAVLQWGRGGPDGSTPCVDGAIRQDPRLAAPATTGTGVPTMLPAAGSPALDRGTGCPRFDALGVLRATPCDLGAVERTG